MQEMTMVERVARAICDSDILWYSGKFPDIPVETIRYKAESELSDNYKQLARTAIEAMREPTDAMINAAKETGGMKDVDDVVIFHQIRTGIRFSWDASPLSQGWRAAIDAALSE